MAYISRLTFPRGRRILDPNESINRGLLGWWPLDGTLIAGAVAIDVSGNGNNGSLISSPVLTTGPWSQAVQTNGSSSLFQAIIPVRTDVPTTISAWLALVTAGAATTTLAWSNPNGATAYLDYTATQYRGTDSAGTAAYTFTPDAAWHHLAFWLNPLQFPAFGFYLDGVPAGNIFDSSNHYTGFTNITAGALQFFNGGTYNYTAVRVRDVRAHSRILSDGEIARLALDRTGNLGWATPVRSSSLITAAAPAASSFQMFRGFP